MILEADDATISEMCMMDLWEVERGNFPLLHDASNSLTLSIILSLHMTRQFLDRLNWVEHTDEVVAALNECLTGLSMDEVVVALVT